MISIPAAVDINPKESPHKQIWHASEALARGSSIFVIANHLLPLENGDYSWFRRDLHYPVVCKPGMVEAWGRYLQATGGDLDGDK